MQDAKLKPRSRRNCQYLRKAGYQTSTYPANIRIKKSPPHSVLADLLHSPTAIKEHTKHALPEIYNSSIFFGFGWFSRVVGHAVLLGNRGNDQGRMQVDKCLP